MNETMWSQWYRDGRLVNYAPDENRPFTVTDYLVELKEVATE